MTSNDLRGDVRTRRLLAAITDAGDTGIMAADLYRATADLWHNRAALYVHLHRMSRDRLVYQQSTRGAYFLPIAATTR